MAYRLNALADGYEPRPSVADAHAVLDSIYVALTDPSRRNCWRDVTYPGESPTSVRRRTVYLGTAPGGTHQVRLQSPEVVGELEDHEDSEDYEDEDTRGAPQFPHGPSLSINAEDIQSCMRMVLPDTVQNLNRAAQTVVAETEDQGRPLSVGVRLDFAGSLSSFRPRIDVEVEPVNNA